MKYILPMKNPWLSAHFRLATLLTFLFPLIAFAGQPLGISKNIRVASGVEIPITVFAAGGRTLLLWLPSENGLIATEHHGAELAKLDIEVWLADLHGAYFLPLVPSSMRQIPVGDVTQLIAMAQQLSGKDVYLVSEGSGAALALQSASRLHKSKRKLKGAILFSPNLYVATPEPGREVEYLPIASRTNLPIMILQPELSPWMWRVDQLRSLLKRGGSKVGLESLPGVRDRFYFREDALPPERALAERLPQLILNAQKSLKEKHR